MKKCSQLFSIYQSFVQMIHTQFSSAIHIFALTQGEGYLSTVFHQFLSSEGTLAKLSCPSVHA
jgi:hypothetical protein